MSLSFSRFLCYFRLFCAGCESGAWLSVSSLTEAVRCLAASGSCIPTHTCVTVSQSQCFVNGSNSFSLKWKEAVPEDAEDHTVLYFPFTLSSFSIFLACFPGSDRRLCTDCGASDHCGDRWSVLLSSFFCPLLHFSASSFLRLFSGSSNERRKAAGRHAGR